MAEGWQRLCALDDIPSEGVRIHRTRNGDIALFRKRGTGVNHDGGLFAVAVFNGCVVAPRGGCAVTFPVKLESDGSVLVLLAEPPS